MKKDEDFKTFINELSSLSGYSKNICEEIFEYVLYLYAIKISQKPDDYANLIVPFAGILNIKYSGDEEVNGELKTNTESYFDVNEDFKKLIGDLHDESDTVLTKLFEKKIEDIFK